jgi:hypothetical protein
MVYDQSFLFCYMTLCSYILIALDKSRLPSRLPINEANENIDLFINYNKKFWEEVISNFLVTTRAA